MRAVFIALLLALTAMSGCSGIKAKTETPAPVVGVGQEEQKTASGEPAYITVQHCLIAFAGTGTRAARSQADAEKLALDLFEQAKGGADFEAMIKKYTDDSPPGIYRMANTGFPGNMQQRDPVFDRGGMVPAFGDTGFPLEVGEFGLAVYDRNKSPFGWHIVKRIK